MATGEQLKLLVKSHYDNEDRFKTIVLQIAAYEANKGHTTLARDLKKIIDKSKKEKRVISNENNNKPFSELISCNLSEQRLNELIVSDKTKEIIDRIIKEYRQRDKLKKFGLTNRRKFLIAGPPGTGKTMTAAVLAKELNLPLCTILMDKMVTKYMGETSVKLRQIFDNISECRGVYLFDEFDAIGAKRNSENDIGEMRRVLNSFLQLIEQDKSESLIIAATNNPNMLDSALFRRFDDVINYTLPTESEIKRIILNRLGEYKSPNLKLDLILNEAINLSHAEITRICNDCIKDIILNDEDYVTEELLLKTINERICSYKY
ncbi:AAA family ATPase [Clostridium perfringens]|uniref:AAA family ATPase n=1 Tax=Clostridium perfringens TaxID=1502 RepID=UPI00232CA245|nr:ATP-binding protein [Clostridium perfringens]MDB2041491.1 ATP-binding protein [Clostridium perfringens]MDB2050111.1 ATP-binding protein [Clostridium perfringens]MDM0736401.1 ATP-binding protein [Clostridium perfringens]MDM0753812.1 ATP-binding protein [Clostridium perfringens]MDU6141889.1 ATP-binding protein [Clostridium perfringens]